MTSTAKTSWSRWAAAFGIGFVASTLVFGQSPRRPPLPEGVVSEDADDAAIRGKRPTANLPANTAPNQVAPIAGQTIPATATPPVTAATTVSTPRVTTTGSVAVAPAAAVTTTAVLPITADTVRAADFGLWLTGDSRGLTISDLATTGPLSGLGLLPGDRIVSINGQPVATERQLLTHLLADNVRDQQVNLTVARDGANRVIQLTPSNLVQGMVQADPLYQAGVVVDPNQPGQLVIQRVFPRTPAYYAGLRVGDVITNVGGQPVVTSADLQRSWNGVSGLPVQVTRAGQPRSLAIGGSVTASGTTAVSGGGMFTNQGRTLIGGTGSAQVTGQAAATGPTAAVGPQGTVAAPSAITPPVGSAPGGLFPKTAIPAPSSAIPPPAAAVPGSTERVPVTIPGASNPPAGNPVIPAVPATAPGTAPMTGGAISSGQSSP